MKAVERLKTEHDLIERGLKLLEKAVARLEAGRPRRVLLGQHIAVLVERRRRVRLAHGTGVLGRGFVIIGIEGV